MSIVLLSLKYLILVFFALFVFLSFRAQRDVPEETKKSVFRAQRTCMYLVHALSFACIISHAVTDSLSFTYTQALILYGAQLFYLIIMSNVIPAVVALNKGMNNIMCMFLTISFIMQTRLNYQASVRQFYMLLASTVVFLIFVFFCKRTSFLHKLTWIYCIIGLALLSAVLILSTVTKGAKLSLDFHGFSFQPMEFVKIVFVLFVAAAFNKANTFRTVVVTAIFAALHIIILVFCRDLGSALILFAIYVFMLYVATKRGIYLICGAAAFTGASFIAYKLFSHVRVRIMVWLDPWADINDKGYQITQALFAIGTGGWFGTGLLQGAPGYVPEVSNDMIMAAISEELGGIFAIFLVFLCIIFFILAMRIAIRLEYRFYKLLAFGLGIAYIFQAFLNIGGTIKFIPLTGVNLPFISLGGSSLLSSMIMVGVLQALYVISEADIERERMALANGMEITELYNDPSDDVSKEEKEEEKRRKKKEKEERKERRQQTAYRKRKEPDRDEYADADYVEYDNYPEDDYADYYDNSKYDNYANYDNNDSYEDYDDYDDFDSLNDPSEYSMYGKFHLRYPQRQVIRPQNSPIDDVEYEPYEEYDEYPEYSDYDEYDDDSVFRKKQKRTGKRVKQVEQSKIRRSKHTKKP